MPLFKAWDVKRVKRKSVVATHFEEFVTGAKRKLGIDSDEVTIYTEADGTEIDVDSFSEIEAGSILICAVGDETWVPAHGTATTTVSTVVSTSMTVYSNRTSTCSSDPQLSTEPGSTQRSIIIKDGNLKAGPVIKEPQQSPSDKQVEEKSKIFTGAKGKPLSNYQQAVNKAALELCQQDHSLLLDRGKLFELSRKKVKDDGYEFAKGKSRARDDDCDEPMKKRVKTSKDERTDYSKLLHEDICGGSYVEVVTEIT